MNQHSRTVVLHRATTPDTVYNTRRLDGTSEYPMQSLTANNAFVTVYPNGLASASEAAWPLTISLQAGGLAREVRMNRVGQVRVR